ncbi:ATP-binding response regulator [Desulfonema magnum]|uniref:histidine kinase n=1 Tax=Desulfonema magnum TaxID=45655 RepID=A0A975BWA4_9BACT|nr:hybrid sensor histidine kinase/response regulator [Desulfonema magnum]QTA92463.1 Two component system response receiver/histidine kinase [Desulfonema magnum]
MTKARILIVEDEYVIAENMQAKLEKEGYVVCGVAPSGKRAIQKAKTEKPDLVLMDIMLKGPMDGIEAANQIRKRFNIPIIYLTAFSDKEMLDRAKITEPFGYLLKPFEDRELYANIEMAFYKARMEQELLKAKKFESVAILAGGIAHDYNNLLSVILGNINMAKEDIRPECFDIYGFLDEAEKATLRAKYLTHQMLTLSKSGFSTKKTDSIADFLKESVKLVLTGSNVSCEFNIPNDLWRVEYDEAQMRHVISNMTMNADQAMPEGGTINVCAENFVVDAEKGEHVLFLAHGKYVKISLQDKGSGISEEHLPMIFDPYFSTKEKGTQKGMGLGLAIVYSVVKKHKGHIAVESEPGVGTTFHIYLPASEKETAEPRNVKVNSVPVAAEKGKKKLLVMDDEEMIRNFLKQMLDRLGCETEFARDGGEAIDLYEKAKTSGEPFDAVILGLTVRGGMGGKEAVWRLKEIDSEVKAIISSGYSNDPVMMNFREYGFAGAIPKPCMKKELNNILHRVLQGQYR